MTPTEKPDKIIHETSVEISLLGEFGYIVFVGLLLFGFSIGSMEGVKTRIDCWMGTKAACDRVAADYEVKK